MVDCDLLFEHAIKYFPEDIRVDTETIFSEGFSPLYTFEYDFENKSYSGVSFIGPELSIIDGRQWVIGLVCQDEIQSMTLFPRIKKFLQKTFPDIATDVKFRIVPNTKRPIHGDEIIEELGGLREADLPKGVTVMALLSPIYPFVVKIHISQGQPLMSFEEYFKDAVHVTVDN